MATATTLLPPIHFTKLFINNEFVDSKSMRTFPSFNPATEEIIAHVSEASSADVDAAVEAAFTASRPGSTWREMDPHERGNLLLKLASLIERDQDYMSKLEALDNGKPCNMALWVDVSTMIRNLRYFAGSVDKLCGSTIPTAGGGLTYTTYEPLGVVACILPFNFPTLGAITKSAPALATGNTVVIKPAEQTPLGALYLASLVKEAGFPPGVFNVISGPGETTGAALVAHPLVRKITFTGSTTVGKIIQQVAADRMKRVTLELGGKNPCIVCPDAEIDAAVKIACGGNFFNSGQICVGISRVFVHESMYDTFIERAKDKIAKRTVGDQWSNCDQGPQTSEEQMNRVLHYIEVGIQEGARLVCGGKRWSASSGSSSSSNNNGAVGAGDGSTPPPQQQQQKGYFICPTLFADVTDNMTIAKEEIFGPVMCVFKYKTLKEVVARANNTEYGLAATVVTKNLQRAMKLTAALECGTVWVNGHGQFDVAAPYGGMKQSGLGREYGHEGLLPYVDVKTVFISKNEEAFRRGGGGEGEGVDDEVDDL